LVKVNKENYYHVLLLVKGNKEYYYYYFGKGNMETIAPLKKTYVWSNMEKKN